MAEYVTDQVTKDWEKGKTKLYAHAAQSITIVTDQNPYLGWWISIPFIMAMKARTWNREEYLKR